VIPPTARLAGAPISWGVCEVPGWGYQLPPDLVLREMRELGLTAAEFGPDGFLPADPGEKARALARYGLAVAGGFVPVILHDPGADLLTQIGPTLDGLALEDTGVLVLAAATGLAGYDARPDLDAAGWATLLANLDRCAALAADRGVLATLHPHVGTLVERRDEVDRVLDGCSVPLCLDTGHLLIGGTDPADLARRATGRIAHAHLKDVDSGWAGQVRSGHASYAEAVRGGMYRPLGQGDVDIPAVVHALEGAGYQGWYVLEQDMVLAAEPVGAGPAADVRASLEYLRSLL
jgi:inosose dehydratase